MIIGDGMSRIHSGEVDVIAEPWPRVSGRYPVIYNHSAASDARELTGWSLPNTTLIGQCLTDKLKLNVVASSEFASIGAAGLPAGSSVGLATWRGRIEEAIAYHIATYGSSGPVGLCGISMGTINSIIYALEHPTNVRWMVLWSPVPLLKEYERDNFGVGTSYIDTGWNVTAHNLPAKADAYTRIMAGELGSIPVMWIDASDDTYSNNAGEYSTKYRQLVAATGGFRQALGPVHHGDGTTVATNFQLVQDFIQAHD